MRKTTSIQVKCSMKNDTPRHGFVDAEKTSPTSATCAALNPNGQPNDSENILKTVLNEIKGKNKGITVPELAAETELAELLIQSHVEELVKRFQVKKGGKKRHGHTVWVART